MGIHTPIATSMIHRGVGPETEEPLPLHFPHSLAQHSQGLEHPKMGIINRGPTPGGIHQEWQKAAVLESRPETNLITTLRLRLTTPLTHLPGQHVIVRLPGTGAQLKSKPYSIASAPGDGREIEIAVERLDMGKLSTYLHDNVKVGDGLEVRGPFGCCFVWNGATPALLVGGGSGVVPLIAMLRHHRQLTADASVAVQRRDTVPLRLAVSVRSLNELPFRDVYREETTVILTRRAPEGWPHPARRLDADTLRPLLVPGATAYVCGSSGFIKGVSEILVELGHPAEAVRTEH